MAIQKSDSAGVDLPGIDNLIPRPETAHSSGAWFRLSAATPIYVDPGTPELLALAGTLAEDLKQATGLALEVGANSAPKRGSILLTVYGSDADLGDEGYELSIRPAALTLRARRAAGLFWGIQTIRQLLPLGVENSGPWELPGGTIRDRPRFAWRGLMLDVARHFFSVKDVKRLIDLAAYHKLNRLHLHLTDDQGWRLMINAWPELAIQGGATAVGGDPGGYYTQADYAAIVAYAQSRYIIVVPEIDTPGHTNAALAAYPQLNCSSRTVPQPYTGIEVGFSSLCIDQELTYRFLDEVIGEVAALTPGPYIHIGGDEAKSTPLADYVRFMERAQAIVQAHGKQMVGWEEISNVRLLPTSIAQAWASDVSQKAAQQGAKVIFSPANRTYLDMMYGEDCPLGLHWAGYVEVKAAYDWDPVGLVEGIGESSVLGVEAPLWSETLHTMADIEFMVFPRLAGVAEIGWSPKVGRSWDDYRLRLARHGRRLEALDVNYYRSPQVDWE
jgi:hexosaminidase